MSYLRTFSRLLTRLSRLPGRFIRFSRSDPRSRRRPPELAELEAQFYQRAIRKPDLWYHDSDHAVLIRSNLVCHDVHFDPIQRIMRPI